MTPLRPTVERRIVSGLRHFLVLLFAIALFAAGAAILIANMKALTIPLLVAIGVLFGLSLLLAIPADFKEAIVFVVPYLPDALVGGRRKTDPPSPLPPSPPTDGQGGPT
jgi:hypothetical protein